MKLRGTLHLLYGMTWLALAWSCGSTTKVTNEDDDDLGLDGGASGSGGDQASSGGGPAASGGSGARAGTGGTGGDEGSGGGDSTGGGAGAPADCDPGATRCASATEVEECESDGWGEPSACEYVCVSGECSGECVPEDVRCSSETAVQTCDSDGEWGFEVDCGSLCEDGECTDSCLPDATRCGSPVELEACDDDGEWQPAESCEFACVDGACGGVCVPDSTRCSSNTQIQTCSDRGQWGSDTTCENACVDDTCGGECTPGESECLNGSESRSCDANGQWEEASACTYVCVDGSCGQNPKTVFVTSTTYDGNMGGLSGADAKCQARAEAAGLSGTYFAWLSTSATSPSSRFTKDVGPYRLVDGTIIANNWDFLTGGTLLAPINVTELDTPAPTSSYACGGNDYAVYTNTREDGTLGSLSYTCGDWTNNTNVSTAKGRSDHQDFWTYSCSGGNSAEIGCGSTNPIYCFEQ